MIAAEEQEARMELLAKDIVKDLQDSIDRRIIERLMLARKNREEWYRTFGTYLEDYGIAEAMRQWPNLLDQELVDTTNDIS